ncbi:MAG: outer membrane beta-barrel protein [Pseudomonadota bacterium]
MVRLAFGCALACASITHAYAENHNIYSPTPLAEQAPEFSWTGAYIGAHTGINTVAVSDGFGSSDGFLGGFHAGFLFQANRFVGGAEVDLSGGSAVVDGVEFTGFASARLRGGLAVDRALVSGTFGVASSYITSAISSDLDLSANSSGYVFGGSFDYAVTSKAILGVEYLQYRFDDYNESGIDISTHSLRLKASYKFN